MHLRLMQKLNYFVLFLFVASSNAHGVAVSQENKLTIGTQNTILAEANKFLKYRNQNLIYNSAPNRQFSANVSAALSARSANDNFALKSFAYRLAGLGEMYTNFTTNVRLLQVRSVKGKLVARIEESTKLQYARIDGDEPPYTEFQAEREFVFVIGSNGLVIESARYTGIGPLPVNEVVKQGVSAVYRLARPTLAAEAAVDGIPYGRAKQQNNETSQRISALAYNYSAMANYAIKYAKKYNPAYRSFSNDCTNFISQAMYAGGWKMDYGWYRSDGNWWYNRLNQTFTWAGAQNWYNFAKKSGRTGYLSNVWSMGLADVLQLDFDRNGNINHTMIVTKKTTSDIYLTYHTTNTLNRSLRSIIAAYPRAWYYAHRT